MINQKEGSDLFEIRDMVISMDYGLTTVDEFIGRPFGDPSTLKIRCSECTIMVFDKDIPKFKEYDSGSGLCVLTKLWRENNRGRSVYHFKEFL